MMLRSIPRYLHIFAVLVFGSMLSAACTQPKNEYASITPGETVVCPSNENIAVCFFSAAYPQSGDASLDPLREALEDALTLPLEELRAKRYPNYRMESSQWTFVQVIGAYFSSGSRTKNGDRVDAGSDGFIEAIKQPEAIPALKKALADLEEAIRLFESAN